MLQNRYIKATPLLPTLPSGIYTPTNLPSSPFELEWIGLSDSGMTTNTGEIYRTIGGASDFNNSGRFVLNHTGDFEVKFKMELLSPGTVYPFFGLSYCHLRDYYANLDFPIYADGSNYLVYENGLYKQILAPMIESDELSIKRTGMQIMYQVGGNTYRTVDIINNGIINIDCSFYNQARVYDIEVIIP